MTPNLSVPSSISFLWLYHDGALSCVLPRKQENGTTHVIYKCHTCKWSEINHHSPLLSAWYFFFWKTPTSRNGEKKLQGLCYRRCRLYWLLPCEEAFAEGLHSPCNTQELAYILSLSSSLPISLSIPLFLSADLQWWIADDDAKVGLLQSLPNADTRLRLFKADIYNPDEFEQAIQGCEFVFHVATPLQHIEGSQVWPNFPSFSSTYTYI